MKVCFLFLISISSFGQIVFEKGYLIDNNNQRTDCHIRNTDWNTNPTEFRYKLAGNDEIKKGDLSNVKEFGIDGFSRFKRADVKIDRSESSTGDLTYERNPVWSQERLFLKVLVDSKASLYSYEDANLERFFYSINDSLILQLLHKKFLVRSAGDIEMTNINNSFRQQLWLNVRCKTVTENNLSKVNYSSKDLTKYFINYNNCEGGSIDVLETKTRWHILNFKITPGFNYSSLNLVHAYYPDINFNKRINLRLGIEIEVNLTSKSSVVFEPTYEVLHTQMFNTQNGQSGYIYYPFLDLPFGFRHYFSFGKNSSVFLNGFYIPSWVHNFLPHPQVTYDQAAVGWSTPTPGSISISHNNSFAFGLGIDGGRLSVETRYYTSRNITNNDLYSHSDYQRLSLIFGYKIFKRANK
jgi:hypothetical protein